MKMKGKSTLVVKLFIVLLICLALIKISMKISPDFAHTVHIYRDFIGEGIYSQIYSISPKIWAHRCNDTRKLREMINKYDGVELDIVFCPSDNGGYFNVAHSRETTTLYPLDDFFEILSEAPHIKVWLDFKNLDKTTAEMAFFEMERLVGKYYIDKKRLIIESENYPFFVLFHENGYYTSFYCPVNDSKYLYDTSFKNEYSELVRAAVRSGNVDAVSFPVSYYSLVKALDLPIDLLTWHANGEQWWDFYRKGGLRRVLDDEQVKGILVKAPSKYHRDD